MSRCIQELSAHFIPASLQIGQRIFHQHGHRSCTQHNTRQGMYRLSCMPEETVDKVQQCVSSDSIPTGPEVTSKMRLEGNIPSFDKKGQQAITKLFGHLHDAHNHMAEVEQAVVDLSEVSSPEQFTFVLQLAVRPIIQLKIPPHLSAPTELKFEKERLTPEEITEENCCNLILPQPFHPKFFTIAFKHQMLGCSCTLFNKKETF